MDNREMHTYQVTVIHGLCYWGFVVNAYNEAEAWLTVLLQTPGIESYYWHCARLLEL